MEQAEARVYKQEMERRVMEAVRDFNAKTDLWVEELRVEGVCVKDANGQTSEVNHVIETSVEL